MPPFEEPQHTSERGRAHKPYYDQQRARAEQHMAPKFQAYLRNLDIKTAEINILLPGAGLAPSAPALVAALRAKFSEIKINMTLVDQADFELTIPWIENDINDNNVMMNYVTTSNLCQYFLTDNTKFHVIFWEHPELAGTMLIGQHIFNLLANLTPWQKSESVADVRASFGVLSKKLHDNGRVIVATHTGLEFWAAQQLIRFSLKLPLSKRHAQLSSMITPLPGFENTYSHSGFCVYKELTKQEQKSRPKPRELMTSIRAHDGLYSTLIFFITFMLTVTSIPLAPVLEYATLTADTAEWGSLGVFAMTVSQMMFHGAGRDGTLGHCKILALQTLLYAVQVLLVENTNNAVSTVTLARP